MILSRRQFGLGAAILSLSACGGVSGHPVRGCR